MILVPIPLSVPVPVPVPLSTFTVFGRLRFIVSIFINKVIADAGFKVAIFHIEKVFDKNESANVICPMSTGKENKLYFWAQD